MTASDRRRDAGLLITGLSSAAQAAWSELPPADAEVLLQWVSKPRRQRERLRRVGEVERMLLLGPDVYYQLPQIIDGS